MESLTYVELDVPFCSLTYGVAPCRARLTSALDPVAAAFDGTAAYLRRVAGLTGAADSKLFTISAWIRINSTAAQTLIASETALAGGTIRIAAGIAAGGRFYVIGVNSAGTNILDQRSSVLPVGPFIHIIASFDLSNSAKRFIYVDDVSDISQNNTYTNDTIDFTVADWSIGAIADGTAKLGGSVAELWCAPGVYLDLSVTANRRKFVTADIDPVDLGATGNTPTGSDPLVFMSGAIAAWHTNKGTGGGFTLTGTLTADEFGTGSIKCFNSRNTCQSIPTFDPATVTLRFAKPTDYLPREIDCIPSVSEVSFTPATVWLGENLGTRATLQVTFIDHPHSDTGEGYDKYLSERDYDPYSQGTFWGKFRARQPFMRGQAIRWITGLVGDDLADMETRNFIIDSFDGPTPDGKYKILAKDVLKLADGDRSQAPAMSTGFLSADITNSATSATLLPSGIGNSEYPASGFLAIGGNEVVSFTRAADVLTIVRAQLGSVASAHKAQDRVQVVLQYIGEDPADIINDLLVNYAGVDPAYITVADWQTETANFLGTVYTANICEPTSVATLISELVEQAALALWDDNIEQQIRLRVLRGIVTDAATLSPDNTLAGTLTLKEQPEKRLSRVQTRFGQIDPTKPLTNLDNYRSASLVIDTEAETDYGSAAIKTINSRWIPLAGRTVADRLGAIQLGRFRDPPRHVTFATARYAETDAELGQGYRVESFCIQDATGAQDNIPIQVTRLNPGPDRFSVEAEEMLFNAPAADLADRKIIFDANAFGINLRSSHDSIYPAPISGDVVTCTINAGVIIGSLSTVTPAFDIGSWPAGVTLNLVVNGKIQARGGNGRGGAIAATGGAGLPGGVALYTRYAVNLSVASGALWGGGGGGGGGGGHSAGVYFGGGGGGGGGAGFPGGDGGPAGSGSPTGGQVGSGGAETVGGVGGSAQFGAGAGGHGGAPGVNGLAGDNASGAYGFGAGGAGGTAGAAIDGVSLITVITGPGDIQGTQIN